MVVRCLLRPVPHFSFPSLPWFSLWQFSVFSAPSVLKAVSGAPTLRAPHPSAIMFRRTQITNHKSPFTTQRGPLPTGNEIRSTFLKFFAERGHRVVRSSSLVPTNDPTLLFTNAGMNQFKDVFLGLEQREYTRATTSQKCVRAGGKHNDLENVGFTNRHHTFFEMLGNFSFGDYFKKDAIAYAWELITSPKWFGIPVEKLTFTVFGGAEVAPGKILGIDEEARDLWISVGAPRDSVVLVPGLKENFWAMGDTGPCGPCSEIHYDMGPAASDQGHTNCEFGCECGRYVEIWNLVFMQYDWQTGTYEGGRSSTIRLLPKQSVDTGAGLERLSAVLQGKISNFDTDLFMPLIERAGELTGIARSGHIGPEAMLHFASLPTTLGPRHSSLLTASSHRTKGEAMSFARSCAEHFGMDAF